MRVAVSSVESALQRILVAQEGDDETSMEEMPSSSDADQQPLRPPRARQLRGVFRVDSLASGLFLTGQRSAEMVLVRGELPPADYLAEVAEELEELLKVGPRFFQLGHDD